MKHIRKLMVLAALLLPMTVWGQTNITALSQIMDANGHYVITQDITGGTPGVSTFNGTLEANINSTTHMPYRIKNLSAPLFTTVTGTVKNLVLENVNISGHSGNTGAVACTASSAARIYNVGVLSGAVGSSDGYTGSLVGFLDGTARVINCYSFADITGGTIRAGIVGYNNYASKYNDLKTMVMNCMFYGNIDYSGGSVYPIYGGLEISNDYTASSTNRLNNYNYFVYEAPFSEGQHITAYNCALAAERRFLVRFEFYRHLLNSTRELAAWYATGTATQSTMHKWVLDKSIAPYPILKEQGKYPSVVNYDTVYTYNSKTNAVEKRDTITIRNHGRKMGTLTVNISVGSGNPSGAAIKTGKSQITLVRTDKDTANYNFNYDKVQLPYYNEVGTGNYTNNKVVTGWKITAMGDGTSGGYTTTNYDAPNYNFADRSTYGKDIFSVSERVYSQGGYLNVPTGVTSITIEPYWGTAVYLSDLCYDRYGYKNNDDLTQIGGGPRYTGTATGYRIEINGSNQRVYTKADSAISALSGVGTPSVYDYAVVLVGNYHHHATLGKGGPELSKGTTPFTIMSVDLNEDNEPDYCLIYRSGKNQPMAPIRFDFITVPGMVMAHKMATDGDLGIPGNCTPNGWFEITTTGLIKYGQFEHSYKDKTLAPVIFMGGVIDQFVANNTAGAGGNQPTYNDKTKYMLFGDNVWFKMLSNGTHMDNISPTPHRPISLIGGEYEKLYLSGYFSPNATACTAGSGDNNAECYIDGGRFGEVAGAGQELISGNVTWIINHADIRDFYGGGINSLKAITGNISTTITNSYINYFCGGPKFGDMSATKTVSTTATDCTFGTYFGAGYGGTAILRECPSAYNQYTSKNYSWGSWLNDSYDKASDGRYRGKFTNNKGVSCGYEHEFFAGSSGNVGRLYIQYASFSLAQTNGVTSTLTGCTVLKNFYGGGSLGAVVGDARSTLTDCTIKGNVFGAGFQVDIPKVGVIPNGGFIAAPNYNESTGVYETVKYRDTVEYEWEHVASLSNGEQCLVDGDKKTIKTTKDLFGLGAVKGNVVLTLKGSTTVGTLNNGNLVAGTGNVYGGGDESSVNKTDGGEKGDTQVILQQGVIVHGNVYGGGNNGPVGGSSSVTIQD